MGLMDLLPEDVTPVPRNFGSEVSKGINLQEKNCTRCGGRYVLPRGAKGYQRTVLGKRLVFCSWKCLREDEAKREKPKAGRKRGSGRPWKDTREIMLKKNEEDQALLDSERGKRLDPHERKLIQNRISERRRKIKREDEQNEILANQEAMQGR